MDLLQFDKDVTPCGKRGRVVEERGRSFEEHGVELDVIEQQEWTDTEGRRELRRC